MEYNQPYFIQFAHKASGHQHTSIKPTSPDQQCQKCYSMQLQLRTSIRMYVLVGPSVPTNLALGIEWTPLMLGTFHVQAGG